MATLEKIVFDDFADNMVTFAITTNKGKQVVALRSDGNIVKMNVYEVLRGKFYQVSSVELNDRHVELLIQGLQDLQEKDEQ